MKRLRIVMHDYGGYAFSIQLSRELARRGHKVYHVYCASNSTTPKGNLDSNTNEPDEVEIIKVELPGDIKKSAFFDRWRLENLYGKLVVLHLKKLDPDVVISANSPLDAQARVIKYCRSRDLPFIFWVQDLISEAIKNILKKKIPFFGRLVGVYYQRKEKKMFRESDYLITITKSFNLFLGQSGVAPKKVSVIPNWAPIDEISPSEKNNQWSSKHGLVNSFVFLYSGTLGFKHNPRLLFELARRMSAHSDVKVVVNSQGEVADWLASEARKENVSNLIVNPYQRYSELSHVLGASDVLIAILEPDASLYSVPSKVLSYFCAKRPVLIAMPEDNSISEIVLNNKLGMISEPTDINSFCEKAEMLYKDKKSRVNMGDNAIKYARSNFQIREIGSKFENVLQDVLA